MSRQKDSSEGLAKGMVVGILDPDSINIRQKKDNGPMVLQFEIIINKIRHHVVRVYGEKATLIFEDMKQMDGDKLVFAEGYMQDDGVLLAEKVLYK